MFTHLHVHSHYSLLEALGSPKAYLAKAAELEMHALALTDYAGMYGAIEFYQAAHKAGIKPILGVEIGYVQDMHHQDAKEQAGTIVLLAKDYTGYQNLLQVVSKGHLEGFQKIPRIDHACLRTYAEGIIALVGGPQSRFGRRVEAGDETVYESLQQLQETLGTEHLRGMRFAQEAPTKPMTKTNEKIQQFATKLGIGMMVSGDVKYIEAADQSTYETALAIKDGKRVFDTDRRRADGKYHLQSEEELRKWLEKAGLETTQIETMITNNTHIADMIDLTIPMDKILFPIYESPDEIKEKFHARQEKLVIG